MFDKRVRHVLLYALAKMGICVEKAFSMEDIH